MGTEKWESHLGLTRHTASIGKFYDKFTVSQSVNQSVKMNVSTVGKFSVFVIIYLNKEEAYTVSGLQFYNIGPSLLR